MNHRRRSISATRPIVETTTALVSRLSASLRRRTTKPNLHRVRVVDVSDVSEEAAAIAAAADELRSMRASVESHASYAHSPRLASVAAAASVAALLHHYGDGGGGGGGMSSRSCPTTPQARRRRYVKEGETQITSLSTLQTHHRYLFLFDDFLLISKQKAECSYKLKEKVPLAKLWLATNNCTHSFLVGWPSGANYVAHFNCENEKDEWFGLLSDCIRRKFRPLSTTISVVVKIDGRQQKIRKTIRNGDRASEILAELVTELDLERDVFARTAGGSVGRVCKTLSAPAAREGTQTYELCYESQALHGIENVFAILMDHIERLGVPLSETQLAHLDTCPLAAECRLVLRCASGLAASASSSVSSAAASLLTSGGNGGSGARTRPALALVQQWRKKLVDRLVERRLFGRPLEGTLPPQPVLTMIDHLNLHSAQIEGLFRKSPKAASVRALRAHLDAGHIVDFHQHSPHVIASLLKEYLRSIPGQILLSGNFHLWMEASDEAESARKLRKCRNLLRLLPPAHTALLRAVLRLLRRVVAASAESKMSARSLAVCIAPSLLENPNEAAAAVTASGGGGGGFVNSSGAMYLPSSTAASAAARVLAVTADAVDAAKKIPELTIFLIENAPELFDAFEDEPPPTSAVNAHHHVASSSTSSAIATPLHQSTDSGLSDGAIATVSDCGGESSPPLFDSPPLSESADAIEFATRDGGGGVLAANGAEELDDDDEMPTRDVPPAEAFAAFYRHSAMSRDGGASKRAPPLWRSSATAQSPSTTSIVSVGDSPRRLSRQCAFRARASSQSSFSSQEPSTPDRVRVYRVPTATPPTSKAESPLRSYEHAFSPPTVGGCGAGGQGSEQQKTSSTSHAFVSAPDELRVADFIVSHHAKKASTDSSRTLIARSDSFENGAKNAIGATRATATTKIAPSVRPLPLIISPKPTVRRALISKNETLGLPPPPPPPLSSAQSPSSSSSLPTATTTAAAAAAAATLATSSVARSAQKFALPPTLASTLRPSLEYSPITQPRRAAPFRPPRRNAEVLLGEKVSWSVNSLRENFLRKQDLVPPTFDQLYANLADINAARIGR